MNKFYENSTRIFNLNLSFPIKKSKLITWKIFFLTFYRSVEQDCLLSTKMFSSGDRACEPTTSRLESTRPSLIRILQEIQK